MEIGHQLRDTPELNNLVAIACFHGRDGLGVGDTKLEWKCLIRRNAREKHAHCLRKAAPHGIQRCRGFRLQVLIDSDMDHCSWTRHIGTITSIVYELRYERCFRGAVSLGFALPSFQGEIGGAWQVWMRDYSCHGSSS